MILIFINFCNFRIATDRDSLGILRNIRCVVKLIMEFLLGEI